MCDDRGSLSRPPATDPSPFAGKYPAHILSNIQWQSSLNWMDQNTDFICHSRNFALRTPHHHHHLNVLLRLAIGGLCSYRCFLFLYPAPHSIIRAAYTAPLLCSPILITCIMRPSVTGVLHLSDLCRALHWIHTHLLFSIM